MTLRQLEDLLRRVLRTADHGIDPASVTRTVRHRAAWSRQQRGVWRAAALAALAVTLLLAWFLAAGWRG